MDSITIEWNKPLSSEVQFLPNIQCFRQDSIRKINDQENKSITKKVHFNCRTPPTKRQAFENTEQDHPKAIRTQKLIFESHDNASLSSSANILTSKLPEIHNEPICSVRAAVITFIIIVLIIIAVAIIVGIIFGTIKTPQNAIRNTNQSSYSPNSSFSTVSTIVMTSSVSIGSQSGAPCASYTTINDPLRNVAQIGLYGPCDNGPLFNTSSGHAWIRFVGSGGTRIALSSPGVNHCGGYVTGWFNGTLPTIFGTMVNGSVCFTTDADECNEFGELPVVYCNGSFYVYLLSPVHFCNARYCTI